MSAAPSGAAAAPVQRSGSGFASAMWPGLWLSALLAVLAFALSFSALRSVGVASGIDARLGWAFPLIIDGFILLATWAAWRFRAQGLAGAWYPWAAFVVFSAVSMTGNALHARPVDVDGLLLAGWAATAFSTVPSIALLVASHMLLLIATSRPASRGATTAPADTRGPARRTPAPDGQSPVRGPGDLLVAGLPAPSGAAGPVLVATPTPARRSTAPLVVPASPRSTGADRGRPGGPVGPGPSLASVPAGGQRVLRVVGDPAPVRALAAVPVRSGVPDGPAAAAGGPELVAWVQAQVRAGRPVTGTELVACGLAASASTARRWLRELRASRPELFTP